MCLVVGFSRRLWRSGGCWVMPAVWQRWAVRAAIVTHWVHPGRGCTAGKSVVRLSPDRIWGNLMFTSTAKAFRRDMKLIQALPNHSILSRSTLPLSRKLCRRHLRVCMLHLAQKGQNSLHFWMHVSWVNILRTLFSASSWLSSEPSDTLKPG